jgi:hypothetical protein
MGVEMRSNPPRLTTLLVLLAAIPVFVVAQTTPTRGFSVVADDAQNRPVEVQLYRKMVAVVIGIDRYADSSMNLSYAVKDAQGMEEVLRDTYGFDPVYALYNEDATKANILELLQTRLPRETGEDDAVLVFFSGHGVTRDSSDGQLGYLVPHDGARGEWHRNISMAVLRDDVSRAIPARHVCFIVDACYGGLLATTRGDVGETSRNAAYLQSIAEEPARQVLTAGKDTETVLDGGPLGYAVFTGRVIEALRNATDYITAEELSVVVSEKVFEDARRRGHTQTPQFGSLSGTGNFVFVPKRQTLGQLRAETARLEASLEASRQEQKQAERLSDSQRQAAELQRQAEVAEHLRQAREEERLEVQRQARAREAAVTARLAKEERREEGRKRLAEETRAEELRRRLEQQQAQQDVERADMTLGEAVTRLSELRDQIAYVEQQVRSEVIQSRRLVRPTFIQSVEPKDEFETTAEFADRKRRIEEGNAAERARHQREVAAADARLPGRLQEATAGFEVAITALRDRERPVGSDGATAALGPYDADLGVFPYEVVVKGVFSPLTGSLEIPRDAARELREAEKAGALIVTLSGRLSEDGGVRFGDPSFGAPNLPKMYPGRSGLPVEAPGSSNRPTGSPEADGLLQELYEENLSDRRRREIGVRLAGIGDPRPGIGSRNGVPKIDWVLVSPGGSVDIKGTRKTVAPFYLSRYPVTYSQYEAFVKADDGFDNSAWWRDMPSKYTLRIDGLDSQRNTLPNAPRDNVNWYQAVAFTRWLSAQIQSRNASTSYGGAGVNGSQLEIRLPTEWEWQWAAQGGSEKHAYPWGSWRDGRANVADVLNSTTAVGMYPQGATMHGVLDMSGNVWEWCLSKRAAPYYVAVDATNEARVLRGSSFGGGRRGASSWDHGSRLNPHDAWRYGGFRVGMFPPP